MRRHTAVEDFEKEDKEARRLAKQGKDELRRAIRERLTIQIARDAREGASTRGADAEAAGGGGFEATEGMVIAEMARLAEGEACGGAPDKHGHHRVRVLNLEEVNLSLPINSQLINLP